MACTIVHIKQVRRERRHDLSAFQKICCSFAVLNKHGMRNRGTCAEKGKGERIGADRTGRGRALQTEKQSFVSKALI